MTTNWAVIAGYFSSENVERDEWLGGKASNARHRVRLIARDTPITSWHQRRTKFTPPNEWVLHWKHARQALRSDVDGIITLFPQLPAVAGLQKLLRLTKKPIVAWMFSIPNTEIHPVKSAMARLTLRHVDRFVVHSRGEMDFYREWLRFPEERFVFVPYTTDEASILDWVGDEEPAEPFVAALGSAHRDFPSFFGALEELGIPATVAASRNALDGIDVPEAVETPFEIGKLECHQLAQRARINVVPLLPKPGVCAAGYVTVVEAMYMGCALIVSDCYTMSDYVIDGETGILVPPNDQAALRDAIERLWNDPEECARLGRNARAYALEHLSEEAGAAALHAILDELTAEPHSESGPDGRSLGAAA